MNIRRPFLLATIVALAAIAAACASDEIEEATPTATPAPTVVETPVPTELDVESFAAINPHPEIREFDPELDLGFDERARLQRDDIEPIYTPKFVPAEESPLRPDEIVMGLAINGDARAYPTGLLRAREMVNDDVGGTPVLVTW